MSITIGDFVKGITDNYSITTTQMTKALVLNVTEKNIRIQVLEHNDNLTGIHDVNPEDFEVVGHQKEFDQEEFLKLSRSGTVWNITDYDLSSADLRRADLTDANLRRADLTDADLSSADLTVANLSSADLRRADLDFSAFPLWCGSLGIKTGDDTRLVAQLAYHLCSINCTDDEFIKMRNSILDFANKFHRVDECGELKPIELSAEENDERTRSNL